MSSASSSSHGGRDLTAAAEIVEGDAILSLLLARTTPLVAHRDTQRRGVAGTSPPARRRRDFSVRRRQYATRTEEEHATPPARTRAAKSSDDQVHGLEPVDSSTSIQPNDSVSQLEELRQLTRALQAENKLLKLQNRELKQRNRTLQAYAAEFEKHCGQLV